MVHRERKRLGRLVDDGRHGRIDRRDVAQVLLASRSRTQRLELAHRGAGTRNQLVDPTLVGRGVDHTDPILRRPIDHVVVRGLQTRTGFVRVLSLDRRRERGQPISASRLGIDKGVEGVLAANRRSAPR